MKDDCYEYLNQAVIWQKTQKGRMYEGGPNREPGFLTKCNFIIFGPVLS